MNKQEERCIFLALSHLSKTVGFGSAWQPLSFPDELFDDRPTPEAVYTDGQTSVGIEVKELKGSPEFQQHSESLGHFSRLPVPHCYLDTCFGFNVPIPEKLKKRISKQIRKRAGQLEPGESAPILIPRHATLQCLASFDGPGFIFCDHSGDTSVIEELGSRVRGIFRLADREPVIPRWGQKFVSAATRSAFQERLLTACEASRPSHLVKLTWDEEWLLSRVEGSSGTGVSIGAGYVGWVIPELKSELLKAIEAAARTARGSTA